MRRIKYFTIILLFLITLSGCTFLFPSEEIEVVVNYQNGSETFLTQTYEVGDFLNQPTDPLRDGFRFEGWYTHPTVGIKWEFGVHTIEQDLILYARWQAVVVITFDFNDEEQPDETIEVTSGEPFAGLENPSREGYFFLGWYTEYEGGVIWNFANDSTAIPITLYARWVFDPDYEFELPSDSNFTIYDLRIEGQTLKWDSVHLSERYRIYLDDDLLIETEETELDLTPYQNQFIEQKHVSVAAHMTGYKEGERSVIRITYIEPKTNALAYETDLESDTQSGYLTGEISLNENTWYFSDALLGAIATDKKNGARAIRIRTGYIETTFSIDYVSKLQFQYATFSNHASNTVTVFAKRPADADWINIKSFTTTPNLVEGEISRTDLENYFDFESDLLFRFQIGSGGTVNLDDIAIYQDTAGYFIGAGLTEFLSYYDGIQGLSGEELTAFLRDLISSNFIGRSYAQAKEILEIADRDPDNPNNVLTIYSRQSVNGPWDSSSWHREHVWPNSRLGVVRVTENRINQGSDLHNLRAIVPSVNSSRSNRVFVAGTGGWSTVGTQGFYPGDDDKGDVARILFYMVVRYEILSLVNDILPNDPATNYTEAAAKMSVLDELLKWHLEDPVDDFERQRNDVIFEYQNNRNPFIDHPELVEDIYGTITLSVIDAQALKHAQFEVEILLVIDQAVLPKIKFDYFVV